MKILSGNHLPVAVKVQLRQWRADSQFEKMPRIDNSLVHKHQTGNVLISRIEALDEELIIGEVVQDVNHLFFYEHPQDHVPGLYLIEAARQFGIALSHKFYGVRSDVRFVLDSFNSTFEKMAETNQPLFIVGSVSDKQYARNGELRQMQCVGTFVQQGQTLGFVDGSFQMIPRRLYERMRRLAAAA